MWFGEHEEDFFWILQLLQAQVTRQRYYNNQQLNSSKTSKTVFLLGAGAMKPWGGPLATDIDNYLGDIECHKTRHYVPQNVFSFLIKELQKYFPGDNSYFETVVAVVEMLYNHSAGRLFQKYDNKGNLPSFLYDCKTWVEQIKDYDIKVLIDENNEQVLEYKKHIHSANGYWPVESREDADMLYSRDLFAFLLDRIGDKITEYDNQDNLYQNSNLNDSLISLLLSDIETTTRIYTLNYDRVVPNLLRDNGIPVFDGFSDLIINEYESGHAPNISKILTDSNCLNYYNLHGSIYWKNSTEISQLECIFLCTPNEHQSNYTSRTHDNSNPKEQFLISNIVAGHHKLQRTNLQPLNAFSYAFQKDCIEADKLVVIGYSFTDTHINRIIRNGIETSGKKQERYFINYFPGVETEEYFSFNKEGHRLSKTLFGVHSFNQKEAHINDKWTSFKEHNCHVYKNGFETLLCMPHTLSEITRLVS